MILVLYGPDYVSLITKIAAQSGQVHLSSPPLPTQCYIPRQSAAPISLSIDQRTKGGGRQL